MGEGVGEGVEWEFGISRRELCYVGWVNHEGLLKSTEHWIQHPRVSHSGKEY